MHKEKIKCIVVDDEPLARDIMENFISRVDVLHHISSCASAYEAFNVLQKNIIDIIFLDVYMPELTGLDFLRDLTPKPLVIFTTAYSNHALEAYNLDAIDYLLKPIEFSRFLKAVGKAVNHLKPFNGNKIGKEITTVQPDSFIYLKVEKKIQKIYLKNILYIESLKNYVKIKSIKREIIAHKTISSVMENLPPKQFLRVHRSFIVAIDQIDAFSPVEIEIKGAKIPIGRKFKETVKSYLGYY